MKRLHILFGLVAAAITLLLAPLFAAGGYLLAYSPITNADVQNLWRKAQGPLAMGFSVSTKELRWIRQFKEHPIPASLREMTRPIKLRRDKNITALPEAGRRAHPSTVNAVDASYAFVHLNGRFSVSDLARWAGDADGARAHFMEQLKWEGMLKVEAMARVICDMFYGFSTGTLALVSGTPTGNGTTTLTITLKNGFGSSLIPGTTTAQKEYICNLFTPGASGKGDKIALVSGGNLVTNAIAGNVDAVNPTNGTITVTFAAAVTAADNNIIVFANGANASTIEHTSYQRHLVGLLDMFTSTSVHGISGATEPEWNTWADTSGGRIDAIRWRKMVKYIENYGHRDNPSITTLMSEGVERDWIASSLPGLRYTDAMSMEQDGSIKLRGKTPRTSPRVPPGMMFVFDPDAIGYRTIHDDVSPNNLPRWGDGQKMIDDSFWNFDIDWAGYVGTTARRSLAYFAGLTEQ